MRKGEVGIFVVMAVIIVSVVMINDYRKAQVVQAEGEDKGIPFYTTASTALQTEGSKLYRRYGCRDCHTLWGVRNAMQSVPSPALDGIGSLREESWFYNYLSAENPQSILPSRLKKKYQMRSYASMPESERSTLAAYLSHLKVEDWYLEETRKAAYEKLTGLDYKPEKEISGE